jgi:major membrane immunogen (membrane-anchored lipoprotein)
MITTSSGRGRELGRKERILGRMGKGPRLLTIILALFALVPLSSCSEEKNSLSDGYFTAESMNYDSEGWKAYLTIYVSNGQITVAEFDARNMSGFRRSWDMDYLQDFRSLGGERLNNHIIAYQSSLVTSQNPDKIQPIPGSGNIYEVFTILAQNAIAQAQKGRRGVVFVKLPTERPR